MISYGAFCSRKNGLFLTPEPIVFAWIILLSCSPTMTSSISLAKVKKRNTCTTSVASKRLPKCSCISSENPRNSNQSKTFLYSRPSTSKSSSRVSTTADRPRVAFGSVCSQRDTEPTATFHRHLSSLCPCGRRASGKSHRPDMSDDRKLRRTEASCLSSLGGWVARLRNKS
jgi:hypothetical protein